MTNPSPEPHPENLTPFKKGDPATVEKARKGGKASQEAQIRKRSMREWAEYYGSLPLHKGRVKEAKKKKRNQSDDLPINEVIEDDGPMEITEDMVED